MSLDEQLAMATNSVAINPTTGVVNNPEIMVQQVPVSPVQEQAAAQVVQTTVTAVPTSIPVQPASISVQPTSIDLEQASQEAEVNYASGDISFGQTISTRPIEPLKIDNGEKVRVTFVGSPFWAKVHRHETLGKILCWSTDTTLGKCCRDLSEPKVNYLIPVLVYSTMPGDPRTALPQGKSELRLVKVWNTASWQGLAEELVDKGVLVNGKINEQALANIDFIITGEGTYGDIKFKATNDSFRQQYASAVQSATEKWNSIGRVKALQTVGRKLDDDKYIRLTQTAIPPQMQDYNLSDIG